MKLISLKTIIVLMCLFLLSYQSWLILMQYLQQNYVSNIKFIKDYVGALPAVTICYDRYLSLQNYFERLPDKDLSDYYDSLMKEVDDLTWDQIDDQKQIQINKIVDDHIYLQYSMMNKFKVPFISSKLLGYQDFFENMTMHGTIIHNNETKYIFSFTFYGYIMNYDNKSNTLTYLSNKTFNIKPIESMFYYVRIRRKCFTLFSALDSKFNKVKANLQRLIIPIHFPRQWFPYRKKYLTYIAIHSPNIMPISDKFININQLGEYDIVYSKVEYQGHPGFVSCVDYNINYKHGNFNMKSDCHFQCLVKHYEDRCHLTLMMEQRKLPYRKTQFPGDIPNITKPCNLGHEEWFFKEDECQRKCPDECHQEYYFWDLKMTEKLSNKKTLREQSIELNIVPSSQPKIIITHLLEMTLMSLVCDFGGLLGIWLGVSLLDILNYCWKIFKITYAKSIKSNSLENNKIFITNESINLINNVTSNEKRRESIPRRRLKPRFGLKPWDKQ